MVKILFLIDDDQDDRDVFKEAVVSCNPNVEVVFAEDGLEAVEILTSGRIRPDVIFLDYNMPRMNGLHCLKKLKADPVTKSIPIIIYTTSGDREEENVVRLLGADHYMKKTVSFSSLCADVKGLLELIDQKVDLRTLKR